MMRKVSLLVALAAVMASAASLPPGAPADIQKRVRALVSRMTLEEKVGQMTEVTIEVVSKRADGRQESHQLDKAKLDTAILTYHVGSILNVDTQAYSLEHWHDVITAIQDLATQKTRLKIPVLYGIDAIHGVTYTRGGRCSPRPSTWLRHSMSIWHARKARSRRLRCVRPEFPGISTPVLDLGRQPLWPRLWETFGEDVYLSSTLGRAYIEGHQGSDMSAPTKGGTCLKHYVGYSAPVSGKDRTAAWISERMMREYFLPAFEEAVKAGSPTVMLNSGEVDGIPGHANYHLITEVLKGEMKFKGVCCVGLGRH